MAVFADDRGPAMGDQPLSRREMLRLSAGAAGLMMAGSVTAQARAYPVDVIDRVLRVVSEEFAVDVESLIGRSRASWIAGPRRLAIYLAQTLTGESPSIIGAQFGNRDGTIVADLIRKMERDIERDPALAQLCSGLAQRCVDGRPRLA